jgi:hypothetical protein
MQAYPSYCATRRPNPVQVLVYTFLKSHSSYTFKLYILWFIIIKIVTVKVFCYIAAVHILERTLSRYSISAGKLERMED